MMAISPLDLNAYDVAATNITYRKLFPQIMEDFLTRKDCQQMMLPSNLPVSAPPPSGNGTCSPIYVGQVAGPGSQTLAQQRKAEKEAGGKAINEGLTKALGG